MFRKLPRIPCGAACVLQRDVDGDGGDGEGDGEGGNVLGEKRKGGRKGGGKEGKSACSRGRPYTRARTLIQSETRSARRLCYVIVHGALKMPTCTVQHIQT